MNVYKNKISDFAPLVLKENLIFTSPPFKFRRPLINILSCQAEIELLRQSNKTISFYLKAKVNVTLECSYTLEHFLHVLELDEEVIISDVYRENDDSIIIDEDYINIEEIVYSLISVNIDMSPIKPGAKLPKGSKHYRFLKEEELKKERDEEGHSPFANLDQLLKKKK